MKDAHRREKTTQTIEAVHLWHVDKEVHLSGTRKIRTLE